ncbi:MAG TPA: hypothetical protein VJ300_09345 [Thermoplasmata archaeon]|nr:hypothetical protein [Thermoplasmata archaeon]
MTYRTLFECGAVPPRPPTTLGEAPSRILKALARATRALFRVGTGHEAAGPDFAR